MTTGIYQLTFSSGKRYIGQSIDVEARWKQHTDKFRKGTAAKPMQAEFHASGYPDADLLLECHKDHLDMMESMYINSNCIAHKHLMLNTSIPKDYTNAEIYTIDKNVEYLKYSIVQLIHQASTAKANISNLENAAPPNVKALKEDIQKLIKVNQMLSLEASKSWWQKLFN